LWVGGSHRKVQGSPTGSGRTSEHPVTIPRTTLPKLKRHENFNDGLRVIVGSRSVPELEIHRWMNLRDLQRQLMKYFYALVVGAQSDRED
jgi:hypothetical protein